MQFNRWSYLFFVVSMSFDLAAPQVQQPRNNSIVSSGGESVKCGGILYAQNGVIQTPGFPAAFETPINCTWLIDASEVIGDSSQVSIVIYLTQLYVLGGLQFNGYLVYDDTFNLRIKSDEHFEVHEEEVTQVMWLKFSTKYLEIQFTMDTLHGTHLRALDRLIDVYGFNITYEVAETMKPNQCNTLKCRFLGNCYAAADFRYEGPKKICPKWDSSNHMVHINQICAVVLPPSNTECKPQIPSLINV